jgi:hypothetical protein
VQGYFRAYYSELRKQIAQHDPDFRVLPQWLRGGRRIEVHACLDGVIILHYPLDENYSEGTDVYDYRVDTSDQVKDVAARSVPERPGGLYQAGTLDYNDPTDFGAGTYAAPIEAVHPLPDGEELIEQVSPWTQMNFADMRNRDVWRDRSTARRDARELIARFLPGQEDDTQEPPGG